MPVRVGVVGGGLIAQVAHLPNLARLEDLYDVCALADPSQRVRTALSSRYGLRPYPDWRSMVEKESLEAVVVCAPHPTHAEVVLGALDAGLHVFVEKPLCIDLGDASRIAESRDRSGLVVQVGYMKRFDPAYDALLSRLSDAARLRHISVVTYDPWMARDPFVDTRTFVHADDVPPEERERVNQLQVEQAARTVGELTPEQAWLFAHVYLACLIHDVNLVHGVVEELGIEVPGMAVSSCASDAGNAVTATVQLPNAVVWNSTWMLLPAVDEFRETAMWYFDDAVLGLEFGAPYLPAAGTRLVQRRRRGGMYAAEDRLLYGSSYERELRHFHDCITTGAACKTPVEQSQADIAALRDLFLARHARASDLDRAHT